MSSTIPILYNKCAPFSGNAKFTVHKFDPNETGEKEVVVNGTCVEERWVFCGTSRDPDYPTFPLLHGPKLQVYGGKFEMIMEGKGESEGGAQRETDSNEIKFRLIYDGTSPEILVIYGTKQRGHS